MRQFTKKITRNNLYSEIKDLKNQLFECKRSLKSFKNSYKERGLRISELEKENAMLRKQEAQK